MRYTRPHKYTEAELDRARAADLLNDARHSFAAVRPGGYWFGHPTEAPAMLAYAQQCQSEYRHLRGKIAR